MVIKIKTDKHRIFTTFLLSVALISKIGNDFMPWYFPFIVSSPVMLMLFHDHLMQGKSEQSRIANIIVMLAMIPYAVAVIYSFTLRVMLHDIVDSGMRSISISLQEGYIVSFAALLLLYYKNDAMEVLSNSVILSYTYTLFIAFNRIGLDGFYRYFTSVLFHETRYNRWFEMHDIGLSVGLLLIYEITKKDNRSIIKTFLLLVILAMCFKRIAIFGFGVVYILWLLLKKWPTNVSGILISVILTCVLIYCFFYIWLISNEKLYEFAASYGVDFSNRRFLFTYVSRLYDFTISFKGHGLGFASKYFAVMSKTSIGWRFGRMAYVHNDILKTFIDLGFIGSLLWFVWYTFIIPEIIFVKAGGGVAKKIYGLATVYAYIVYSTDNTSTYFLFQLALYALIIHGCFMSVGVFYNRERECSSIKECELYSMLP